jgi:hypothetical protein
MRRQHREGRIHPGLPGAGGAVIVSQNSRSLATRRSGALPAMIAALIAPIEMPATQSGR